MIDVWCGIDPGLAHVGATWLMKLESKWRCLGTRTVNTSPKDPMQKRLSVIFDCIREEQLRIVSRHERARVHFVFEDQQGVRRGMERDGLTNAKAALVERVVGLLWAIPLMDDHEPVVHPIEVTTQFGRQCLGLPRAASKQQIGAMVRRLVTWLPAEMSTHATDSAMLAIAGERKARGRC